MTSGSQLLNLTFADQLYAEKKETVPINYSLSANAVKTLTEPHHAVPCQLLLCGCSVVRARYQRSAVRLLRCKHECVQGANAL